MSFKTFVQHVSAEMAPIGARASTKGNQSLNEVVNFYWLYDFSQRTFFKLHFKREQRTGGKKSLFKSLSAKKVKAVASADRDRDRIRFFFVFKKKSLFSFVVFQPWPTLGPDCSSSSSSSCFPVSLFFQERGVTLCRHDIGSFAVASTTSTTYASDLSEAWQISHRGGE